MNKENCDVNNEYGFILIECYKSLYFPGQILRGHIILDLFNPLPSHVPKKLMIRIVGKEFLGKNTQKIAKKLIEQPESFKSYHEL